MNKIKRIKLLGKRRFGRYLLVPATLAVTAASSFAEDGDLWDAATTAVNGAKASLVTFLGVMILVPLAFFAYRLVSRAFGSR